MSQPTTSQPHPLSPAQRRLCVNLALGCRQLSSTGHDDFNQGQLSARLPGAQTFLIKGALCGFSEARPHDMVISHIDHQAPPDRLAPPELPLHQAIYQARPDINAIVHSHAPNTLVFGALQAELCAISHDAVLFIDRCPRFTLTSNTILEIQIGRAVAQAMGENNALFLQNHGGVVVGTSLRHAVVAAQLLERACELQIKAMSAGVPFACSGRDDIENKRDYIYSDLAIKSYWDYGIRRVRELHPEAAQW